MSNLEYDIQRDQIRNYSLNHGTKMNYIINQHLSNLKKGRRNGLIFLF